MGATTSESYQPEIDGLRAVAVSAVLIFHFFPEVLMLGYLGVDIFFVISGYLITGHLLSNSVTAPLKFLKTFYIKRIKRLFPALAVFLFVSSIPINYFFIEIDIARYLDSLKATMTFWANWFFWRDGGYFGGHDQLKPLLHMWSLSVEEQFYILYPTLFLIILSLFSYNKNAIIACISFSILSSFILWLYLYSIGGGNPAFFLLPTRAWQFGLGSILAFLHSYNMTYKNPNMGYSLYPFGIGLIVLGLTISFNQVLNTILVTMGSFFFLAGDSKKQTLLLRTLSSKLAVGMGKISYSVYLYHWPIAVLLLYISVDTPKISHSFLGIALSIICGILSYTIVEKRFRYELSFKHSLTLIVLLSISALTLGEINLKFSKTDQVSKLAKNSATNFRCSFSQFIPYGSSRACRIGDQSAEAKTIFLGNSHAQMYAPLLSETLKSKAHGGLLVPLNGCLPTTEININEECRLSAQKNLDRILEDQQIRLIFIGSTWYAETYYFRDGSVATKEELPSAFKDLIAKLSKSGKTVSLISPIQTPLVDLSSALARRLKFNHISAPELEAELRIERSIYDYKFSDINSVFRDLLGDLYIEPHRDLCDDTFCYFGDQNSIFFADQSHLSAEILARLKTTRDSFEQIVESKLN